MLISTTDNNRAKLLMENDTEEFAEMPPVDFNNLEDNIRIRILTEILYKAKILKKEVYYEKYPMNAEILDRDYKVWLEMEELDKEIVEFEKEINN